MSCLSNTPDIDECPICVERITNIANKSKVSCPYCSFITCRQCVKTFLLNSIQDPSCMNCKKPFSNQFIHATFPKSFYQGEYKTHREEVLYQREKSLLPATMAIVEEMIKKERKISHYQSNIHTLKYNKRIVKEEIEAAKKLRHKNKIASLKEEKSKIEFQIKELEEKMTAVYHDNKDEPTERKQFIKSCPVNDCRGFLSTSWKCGLCATYVCSKCHAVKDGKYAEHTCNPEDVKSAELIMKDTKSCPKCGIRIFKIEGCDQMFCVSCHTPFEWKTGKLISHNHIHNPHYFEWLRTQKGEIGRQDGDLLCGGYDTENIIKKLREYASGDPNIELICSDIHYSGLLHNWVLDRLRYYPSNDINDYLPLRIKYLRGEIDEDKFKVLLQRAEKKTNKLREEADILRTYTQVISDELTKLTLLANDKECDESIIEDIIESYENCKTVKVYVNDSLRTLSRRYGNVCVIIGQRKLISTSECETEKQ